MITDRWVRLEGVANVRDLGGLPLRDGGRTRFGQLLRSAGLSAMTVAGVEFLPHRAVPAHHRDRPAFAKEVEREGPTSLERAGVRTEHLSVLPSGQRPIPREDEDWKLADCRGCLSHCPDNMLAAVRLLTEPDAGPALVHCAGPS